MVVGSDADGVIIIISAVRRDDDALLIVVLFIVATGSIFLHLYKYEEY